MSWALVPEIQKPVIISSNYLSLVQLLSSRGGAQAAREPSLTSHLSRVRITTAECRMQMTNASLQYDKSNNLTRFLVIKSDNRQTLVNFTKLVTAAMIKHQTELRI